MFDFLKAKRTLIAGVALPFILAACAAPQATISAKSDPNKPVITPAPSIAVVRLPSPPIASSLVNVSPTALTNKLGAPQFRRTEPSAEIWRYGADGCLLLVFLYEDQAGLRSTHLDARKATGGPTDLNACLASVSNAYHSNRS